MKKEEGEMEEEEKEINVLLVEDLEEHVLIITHALERSELRKRVFVTRDGEEALDFLYNRGKYLSKEEYPKPDIILLDLRLPKLDGIEVLKRIRREEELKDIPVIVLTSSKRDEDIIGAYKSGVSSYLLKSTFMVEKTANMEGLLDAILSLV